jgi:cytochrome o ubiquinol oxidase subunit 2
MRTLILKRPTFLSISALALAALLALPSAGAATLKVHLDRTSTSSVNAADLSDLNPAGPVTHTIDELFWITGSLMLLVLIPVFVMTAWFAWRYRASNRTARYEPDWEGSSKIEWFIWLVPALIVVILAGLTWVYTHKLDPYKPLPAEASVKPLEIQVVALDWKWLFIYPEQQLASVNELALPVNRPVDFHITSATVMNSFFIPRLGGQIYAMAGMETRLHLMANQPGQYFGENTQYSGRGFPFQHFSALALAPQGFEDWVQKAKASGQMLDMTAFKQLTTPTARDPVSYYSAVTPNLFMQVMMQFDGPTAFAHPRKPAHPPQE